MSDHPALDAALMRLAAALDQCEAAAGRVGRLDAEKRAFAVTVAASEHDRERLAAERNAAVARTRALEQATENVALRLGHVGGTLRRLLADAD